MQADTRLVISGSFALQFFSRITYDSSDMDLYVDSRGRKRVCFFLVNEAGYKFQPTSAQSDDLDVAMDPFHWRDNEYPNFLGIGTILTFERNFKRKSRRIQLMLILEHTIQSNSTYNTEDPNYG